ncbi:MAG: mechanosensitive ion channel family protein [Bacilli bacterium]
MEKFINVITNEKIYLPVVYIVIGVILNMLLSKIIDKIIRKHKGTSGKDKRKETIINLVSNVFKYLILIFVVLGILKLYGVDTTSIIASLGVFAAVIGLAFQDILKDLLAGASIIFDNKYAVGDVIEINGFKGTVIELGLRTTKIKAFTGEVKSIGNSSFSEVINFNLAKADLFMKLNVAYDTDLDKLEKVLESLRDDIMKIDNVIDYKLLGVDELGESSVVYMVDISCNAMTGAIIKRQVLRLVKDAFDKEKISIPYTTIDINVRK